MDSSAGHFSPEPAGQKMRLLQPQPAYTQSPRLAGASSPSSLLFMDDVSHPSISEKYALPIDLSVFDGPEEDDSLHDPDSRKAQGKDSGHVFSMRGFTNLGCLVLLVASIFALFTGYPIATYLTKATQSYSGGFNLGGINASGQLPDIPGLRGPIDRDTPQEVRTKVDYVTGQTWQLVFSDEFNVEDRTFYPGDDPYWEAADLHYWATNNKEWYDPNAITTRNGSLEIEFSARPNHNLNYTGGMMSTWNKFCFTGGLVEARVMLPGYNNVAGLWPAVWAMGNLGRAGYGATTDGTWPYTYDACDIGTVADQLVDGQPVQATVGNDEENDGALSRLPGQRLSRCTCPGESHPGPVHDNGEYVGRSAPEIDMFEAQIGGSTLGGKVGAVSQSGQWAPFNWKYNPTGGTYDLANATISKNNTYLGGIYQQASSVITETDQTAYEFEGANYSIYGFQYKPGFGDAYITWIANGKISWTLYQSVMGADSVIGISERPVPQEPMYLITNLGMSANFGEIDFDQLTFPSTLRVDYIRVYQDPSAVNIGCDPPDFPTAAYINQYSEAYNNPNLTTWVQDYNQTLPKNSFLGQC
ncbi:beta-glucan synthesis-associated protein [Ganoderma leucocontextum]|nr:beta-glucan synthesis-associated protein [Ganoderma leucocontextum]